MTGARKASGLTAAKSTSRFLNDEPIPTTVPTRKDKVKTVEGRIVDRINGPKSEN